MATIFSANWWIGNVCIFFCSNVTLCYTKKMISSTREEWLKERVKKEKIIERRPKRKQQDENEEEGGGWKYILNGNRKLRWGRQKTTFLSFSNLHLHSSKDKFPVTEAGSDSSSPIPPSPSLHRSFDPMEMDAEILCNLNRATVVSSSAFALSLNDLESSVQAQTRVLSFLSHLPHHSL